MEPLIIIARVIIITIIVRATIVLIFSLITTIIIIKTIIPTIITIITAHNNQLTTAMFSPLHTLVKTEKRQEIG